MIDSGSPEALARDRIDVIGYAETERRLAAKEQEVAQLKAELTAAYESLGRDDTRARDAESQIADLKRELEEARKHLREYSGWSPHQFTGLLEEHRKLQKAHVALDTRRYAAESRTKELEEANDDLRAQTRDALSRLAALISAAEPFLRFLQSWDAMPIRSLDPVDIYAIHGGEDVKPHGATLKWPDLRALASAVQKAREGQA